MEIKEFWAVYEVDSAANPIYGIYVSLADAEEAIFTEAESFAYEILMGEDPEDVRGEEEWDYLLDNKWLMEDCASCFAIQKINFEL